MFKFFCLLILCFLSLNIYAQKPVNWTPDQLMEPAELAKAIHDVKNMPVIISVGPGAIIPHSLDLGMLNDSAGVERLRKALREIPKDAKVVVYCGCCPFEHCPNVRPAIDVLKEMKFTNYYLLDLPVNIKSNWIDNGYPVKKQ